MDRHGGCIGRCRITQSADEPAVVLTAGSLDSIISCSSLSMAPDCGLAGSRSNDAADPPLLRACRWDPPSNPLDGSHYRSTDPLRAPCTLLSVVVGVVIDAGIADHFLFSAELVSSAMIFSFYSLRRSTT